MSSRHAVGRLAMPSVPSSRAQQLERLDVLGDGLAQREAVVRPDAQCTAAPTAPACRRPSSTAPALAVLPDEPEHLVRVAGHATRSACGRSSSRSRRPAAASARRSGPASRARCRSARSCRAGARGSWYVRVVRPDLAVGGEQRAEVVAELQVDRRGVVERADGHGQQVVGGVRALLDDPPAVELPPRISPSAFEPLRPDLDEGVHHRRHQDLAAAVRLLELVVLEVAWGTARAGPTGAGRARGRAASPRPSARRGPSSSRARGARRASALAADQLGASRRLLPASTSL